MIPYEKKKMWDILQAAVFISGISQNVSAGPLTVVFSPHSHILFEAFSPPGEDNPAAQPSIGCWSSRRMDEALEPISMQSPGPGQLFCMTISLRMIARRSTMLQKAFSSQHINWDFNKGAQSNVLLRLFLLSSKWWQQVVGEACLESQLVEV